MMCIHNQTQQLTGGASGGRRGARGGFTSSCVEGCSAALFEMQGILHLGDRDKRPGVAPNNRAGSDV